MGRWIPGRLTICRARSGQGRYGEHCACPTGLLPHACRYTLRAYRARNGLGAAS